MMTKRALSLLEVVVVIALIAMAGGTIGWRLHQMIAEKRLTSCVEKFRSRLHICRRLALNMQADWRVVLEKKEKKCTLSSFSPDSPKVSPLPILSLDSFFLLLNGEEKEALAFDFTSTGEVYPKGVIKIASSKEALQDKAITWILPDLFFFQEGKELGPIPPDEIKKRKK